MPTPTYDLIEEKVLGSAQASVTFSSIPGTYKDLVLEYTCQTTVGAIDIMLRFNGNTSSLYSTTILYGDGSAAGSTRQSNQTSIYLDYYGAPSNTRISYAIVQIFSYANTNVNKTVISRAGAAASGTDANVGLWRSTSAVTSIDLLPVSGNSFTSGSTFRLWGVAG